MSDQAIKRKAFLEGLFGFYFGEKEVTTPTSETEAMKKDWQQAGGYLREAMDKYERQTLRK